MAKKREPKLESFEFHPQLENKIKIRQKKFKFTPKQVKLLDLLIDPNNSIVLIAGPAGTSKTYMALYAAVQLMSQNKDKTLLYVRSIAESADKGLGSLPGEINDKFAPFLMPLYDKLDEIMPPQESLYLKNEGRIDAIPINYLRGASWTDKIVVADECQNFNLKELTTLMTRVGEGTKLILCGDFMQSDINGKSGFKPIFNAFDDEESKSRGVQTFTFTRDDIVRSEILKFLVERLEKVATPS